jgi:hypothetical protein
MLAATSGADVLYLCPDLPARDIAASASPAHARAVVLGVTRSTEKKSAEAQLRAVARHLPDAVELWVGGPNAQRYAVALGHRAVILEDYDAFSRELARISSQ